MVNWEGWKIESEHDMQYSEDGEKPESMTIYMQNVEGLLHLGNLPVAKFKIAQFINLVAFPSSKENAYLRNVVENCEGETRENEPEKEEETDDGFVNVAIFDVAQTVARDVVAQADGGDRDEDEVGGVQKGPLVFQDEEHQAWNDDWEKENLRKSRVSRDLSTLR